MRKKQYLQFIFRVSKQKSCPVLEPKAKKGTQFYSMDSKNYTLMCGTSWPIYSILVSASSLC